MSNTMWTDERKLEALLRLPWSLQMSRNSEDGYWVMRVAELPAALATASTPEELEPAFWESLRETLAVFLTQGDEVPLPRGVTRYPWLPAPNLRMVRGQINLRGVDANIQETAALAFATSQQAPLANA